MDDPFRVHRVIDASPTDRSFYKLADKLIGKQDHPSSPFRRFLELMRKMRSRAFVHEELIVDGELEYERCSVEQRRGSPCKASAIRLSFFACPVGRDNWLSPEQTPNELFLGYAIVLHLAGGSFRRSYVYEAVAARPVIVTEHDGHYIRHPAMNYYVHSYRPFSVVLGIPSSKQQRRFTLEGSYFCQQNGISQLCGHAAIRMAMNSTEKFGGKRVTNKDIDRVLDIDQRGSKLELKTDGISKAIRALGADVIVHDFEDRMTIDYERVVYPYMESGLPVILGISGPSDIHPSRIGHVITIVGHTFNSDRWYPQAKNGYSFTPGKLQSMSASEWCDHFLANDDNFGMYLAVQSDLLRSLIIPSKNPLIHALTSISLRLPKMKLDGFDAEMLAVKRVHAYLNQVDTPENYWTGKLITEDHVYRTFLVDRSTYLDHLFADHTSIGDHTWKLSPLARTIRSALPNKKLWLVELTVPALYSSRRRRIGEVILDPYQPPPTMGKKSQCTLLVRLPGLLWTRKFETQDIDIVDHVTMIKGDQDAICW